METDSANTKTQKKTFPNALALDNRLMGGMSLSLSLLVVVVIEAVVRLLLSIVEVVHE